MIKKTTNALSFAVLLLSGTTEASLIGEEFILEHRFDGDVINSGTVIVEEGSADSFDMLIGNNINGPVGYAVDINSSSINIDFYFAGSGSYFSPSSFNGLYFSNEVFGANKFIETATIYLENFNFDQSRIILLDEHSIGLNFSELYFYDNSLLTISFDVTAVPVPAAVWLFGSGIIGLIGLSIRKKL